MNLDDNAQGKQKVAQFEENSERIEVKRIRIKLGGNNNNNNKVDVKGKQVEKNYDKAHENQEISVNNVYDLIHN